MNFGPFSRSCDTVRISMADSDIQIPENNVATAQTVLNPANEQPAAQPAAQERSTETDEPTTLEVSWTSFIFSISPPCAPPHSKVYFSSVFYLTFMCPASNVKSSGFADTSYSWCSFLLLLNNICALHYVQPLDLRASSNSYTSGEFSPCFQPAA